MILYRVGVLPLALELNERIMSTKNFVSNNMVAFIHEVHWLRLYI